MNRWFSYLGCIRICAPLSDIVYAQHQVGQVLTVGGDLGGGVLVVVKQDLPGITLSVVMWAISKA